MITNIKQLLKEQINKKGITALNEIRTILYELSPLKHNPVDNIQWVKIDKVIANDYNPNIVASNELKLLSISIEHDGYTQPIVTIFDKKLDKYVIIDGFHRYFVCKKNEDILKKNKGLIPIVVIDKDINDRMASTIRHNRARGKHNVSGMGKVVLKMIENGWDDANICNELGLEPDELIRLKHVTGVAKLFENREYSKSYKEVKQIEIENKEKK